MKIDGGRELARAIRQLPDALQSELVLDALEDGAEPMRARMAATSWYEPGPPDIRDHFVISKVNRAGDVGGGRDERLSVGEYGVAVGPSKDFFYGAFNEFGTVHQPARPVVRPAFDTTAQLSLSVILKRLWNLISGKADQVNTGGRFL